MAQFPKVQSPCPYKDRLASVMEGDFCRMCSRNVFDLTHMTDGERRAFIAGCSGEVCVSYRLPLRPALAAAALAASVAALPAAAAPQDDPAPIEDVQAYDDYIIVGGIKDLDAVEYVEDAADASIPELPVVYDDEPVAPKAPVKPTR